MLNLSTFSPLPQLNFTTIWEREQSKQKQNRKIGELFSHKMLIKITERR